MELANILLGLGGDHGNSVPKYAVTAAEIALLRAIHGEDAVYNILPLEKTGQQTNRQELNRLQALYGGARDAEGASIISKLYPGAGARVFETLEELELPEDLYVALTRVKPTPKDATAVTVGGAKGKRLSAAEKKAADAAKVANVAGGENTEGDGAGSEDDDGISDMDDVFS